jgi:hypothetical protein
MHAFMPSILFPYPHPQSPTHSAHAHHCPPPPREHSYNHHVMCLPHVPTHPPTHPTGTRTRIHDRPHTPCTQPCRNGHRAANSTHSRKGKAAGSTRTTFMAPPRCRCSCIPPLCVPVLRLDNGVRLGSGHRERTICIVCACSVCSACGTQTSDRHSRCGQVRIPTTMY